MLFYVEGEGRKEKYSAKNGIMSEISLYSDVFNAFNRNLFSFLLYRSINAFLYSFYLWWFPEFNINYRKEYESFEMREVKEDGKNRRTMKISVLYWSTLIIEAKISFLCAIFLRKNIFFCLIYANTREIC